MCVTERPWLGKSITPSTDESARLGIALRHAAAAASTDATVAVAEIVAAAAIATAAVEAAVVAAEAAVTVG